MTSTVKELENEIARLNVLYMTTVDERDELKIRNKTLEIDLYKGRVLSRILMFLANDLHTEADEITQPSRDELLTLHGYLRSNIAVMHEATSQLIDVLGVVAGECFTEDDE